MSTCAKVYGPYYSTCTQRVLTVLEETGTPYELVDIDMRQGKHKDPIYISNHHPFARVPALEDSSVKLFESCAICRYLADKFNRKVNLLGPNSDLPQFEQAASVEYSYFDPPFAKLSYERIFKNMMGHGEPNEELISQYQGQICECFDYYESVLAQHEYLVGPKFTFVDIYHLPWISFLHKFDMWHEIESRPHLLAWWNRVSNRPAWKKVCSLVSET